MAGNTFWTSATLEPKRKYRFRVILGNKLKPYIVTKIKNPAMKISETPHKFLNHTFYYPGRAEWDPIDISFVDPGGDMDTTAQLLIQAGASGYRTPDTEAANKNGFTKYAATEKGVGNVVIEQLGVASKNHTNLVPIGQWELSNAFFTNITWGDYDYNGEEMLECSCTIRYDYAEYIKRPNTNVLQQFAKGAAKGAKN